MMDEYVSLSKIIAGYDDDTITEIIGTEVTQRQLMDFLDRGMLVFEHTRDKFIRYEYGVLTSKTLDQKKHEIRNCLARRYNLSPDSIKGIVYKKKLKNKTIEGVLTII